MNRSIMMSLLCCCLLPACATHQASIKQRSVEPGKEVLIGEFGYWKKDCTSRSFDIRIKQQPRYGTLRYGVGSLVIPANPEFGTAGECADKLIESRKIFYVAGPTFVETDRVSYSVPGNGPFKRKIYDVEVEIK